MNEDRISEIRKWGGFASDALLDPSYNLFKVPDIEGFIGYRIASRSAIVLGDPVCNPKDIPQITSAFHDFCKEKNLPIIYLSTSQSFAEWAIKNHCKISLEVGEELTLDPHNDPREKTGVHASLVRRKVKHAIHEGVTVEEYVGDNEELEKNIELVGIEWLKARKGAQIHISKVNLFEDRQGKRWLYALCKGKIVGVLQLNELKSQSGWLINHLMITPDAPHGTPEILVISTIEKLRNESCHFATFGPVMRESIGKTKGLGHFTEWLVPKIFKTIRKAFHLDGLKTFWGKYEPSSKPLFVLFSRSKIGVKEMISLSSALNVRIKEK